MKRIFGIGKKAPPPATLDDASKGLDARDASVGERIKKLDDELIGYKQKIAKAKGPAKKALQQKAMKILKQKKMYEKQQDNVRNQLFNIDQTKFAQESVKDTATIVSAMKNANKELKKAYLDIDINEVEDLHDDMEDLLEDANEVQEILGRSYGVPEELDEDELLAELDDLEEEMTTEQTEEVPDYMVSAASAKNVVNEEKKLEVDEYGLPAVPISM